MTYLALLLGVLIVLHLVVRYDMYEREPWWMLLLALAVGAGGMWSAFFLQRELMLQWPVLMQVTLYHAAMAGLFEEFSKLLVVVAVVVLMPKQFNDPMDGLIYGAMAGLGAGAFEAAWFMRGAVPPVAPLIGTAAVRLFMHTVWGGMVGFGLGLIVIRGPWVRVLVGSYVVTAALHAAWDYWVGFEREQTAWHTLLAAGFLAISTLIFGVMVARAHAWSGRHFDPDRPRRLVGPKLRRLMRSSRQ